MPALALLLSCVHGSATITPEDVLPVGYSLQVAWVNTGFNPAQMIEHQPLWYWPVFLLPCPPMRVVAGSLYAERPVSPVIHIAAPQPAGRT